MSTITPLTPAEIRVAVKAMGHRGNSVRPPVHASLTARTVCEPFQGPMVGARIVLELFAGRASDGYKSDFTARPRWWVLLSVQDSSGHRYWALGRRFSNQVKARAEYDQSALDMDNDGEIVERIEA